MNSQGADNPFTDMQHVNNTAAGPTAEPQPPPYSEQSPLTQAPTYAENPVESGLYQQGVGKPLPSDPPPPYSDSGVIVNTPCIQELRSVTTASNSIQTQPAPLKNQTAPAQDGCCSIDTADDCCTLCLCCCLICECCEAL